MSGNSRTDVTVVSQETLARLMQNLTLEKKKISGVTIDESKHSS
jgi:hypothetical protein